MIIHIQTFRGLPWWRSGWESACQCRGHGFEPWSGRIPHAAEQLGPWATTTEPAHLEPVLPNKKGRDSERPAHRDEEWPPLAATRESPRTEAKTQHSQKKKKKFSLVPCIQWALSKCFVNYVNSSDPSLQIDLQRMGNGKSWNLHARRKCLQI